MWYKWQRFLAIACLTFLCFFFFSFNDEFYNNEQNLLQHDIAWKMVINQINYESKSHYKSFEKMQRNSPLLQSAKYQYLAGMPPQEKKLLTVGILSMQRPKPLKNYLLSTLESLFQSPSEPQMAQVVVLIYLVPLDLQWLRKMVIDVKSLFRKQIDAHKLLLIRGQFRGPHLLKSLTNTSCEAIYSRQNSAYALLMNFAANLSDHFLILEDNVHCDSKFVPSVIWTLAAWRELPWVILEFSSFYISGKVFHTSDLQDLSSFFLLFHTDTPIYLLLSSFLLLMGQTAPISISSSLILSFQSYYLPRDECYQKEESYGGYFREPNNPPAKIYTNMQWKHSHVAQNAYFLNESYFETHFPQPGSTYTLVFDQPHKVIRIQILTGLGYISLYQLQSGQVLLGYDPLEEKGCSRYSLLGPLVRGEFDQLILPGGDSEEDVRCVQLLVIASQDHKLVIRQLNIWTSEEYQ